MDHISDECLLLSHFIIPGSIFLIHIWNRSSWSCLLKLQLLFIYSYSNLKFEFWQNDLPHGFLILKAGYQSPSIIFYNILFLPSFPHFSSHLYISSSGVNHINSFLLCFTLRLSVSTFLGWIFKQFSCHIAEWSCPEEKEKNYLKFT